MKVEGWERKRYSHVDAITWMSNTIAECEKGIIPEGYEKDTDLKKLAQVLRACIKNRNVAIDRINIKIRQIKKITLSTAPQQPPQPPESPHL